MSFGERTISVHCGVTTATLAVAEGDVDNNNHQDQCRLSTPLNRVVVTPPSDPNNGGTDMVTNHQSIFDPVAALSAFLSGTHQFHVRLEVTGRADSLRHTGSLWLTCTPIAKDGKQVSPLDSHALLRIISSSPTANQLTIKVPAIVRSNLLAQVIASQERQLEIKKALKKSRKNPAHVIEPIPSAIPVPTVPRHVKPLSLQFTRGNRFKRVHILLTVRGHRILFLEPPNVPFINRRIQWEARLLYPNYPTMESVEPIQGTHYTLLMNHSDPGNACCGIMKCYGATGVNGKCHVQLQLISSLASIQPPSPSITPSDAVNDMDDATEVELTLAVLALIPTVTKAIHWRKRFFLLSIPLRFISFLTLIITVYNWVVPWRLHR